MPMMIAMSSLNRFFFFCTFLPNIVTPVINSFSIIHHLLRFCKCPKKNIRNVPQKSDVDC